MADLGERCLTAARVDNEREEGRSGCLGMESKIICTSNKGRASTGVVSHLEVPRVMRTDVRVPVAACIVRSDQERRAYMRSKDPKSRKARIVLGRKKAQ